MTLTSSPDAERDSFRSLCVPVTHLIMFAEVLARSRSKRSQTQHGYAPRRLAPWAAPGVSLAYQSGARKMPVTQRQAYAANGS
jgi:hypothetical protein